MLKAQPKAEAKYGDLEFALFRMMELGPLTGYDATKIFRTLTKGWSHQQVYRCLKKYNGELWTCVNIPQEGKPDKKVYTLIKGVERIPMPEDVRLEVACNFGTHDELSALFLTIEEEYNRLRTIADNNKNNKLLNVLNTSECWRLMGKMDAIEAVITSGLVEPADSSKFVMANYYDSILTGVKAHA